MSTTVIADPANPQATSASALTVGPCQSCSMSVPVHRVAFAICAHCLPARVSYGPSTRPTQWVTKTWRETQP